MKNKIIVSTIPFLIFACFFILNKTEALAFDTLSPWVKIFNLKSLKEENNFLSFDSNFKGGASVAAGDVDGDEKDEIITAAGPGGGPHVRIFEGNGEYTGWDVFAFHPSFRGGLSVATGDIDGDLKDEIIVGQAARGESWIKVYKADKNKTILAYFRAFDAGIESGVSLAAGDIDADGKDEIIVGPGPGGFPKILVFKGNGTQTAFEFIPFHPDFRGGLSLASGDVDGDSKDDIVVAQAGYGEAWVKVYKVDAQKTVLNYFRAYAPKVECGATVAVADVNFDGQDEIITAAGPGGGPHVRIFDPKDKNTGFGFMAYDTGYRGGVYIALGNVDSDSQKEIITSPGRRGVFRDIKLGVPNYKQEHNLSCEISSLRMSLAYKNVFVSESALINQLKFDPTPHKGDIWGDPNKGFVGDINGKQPQTGYGVYWEPISELANKYRPSAAFTGWSLQRLLWELAAGNSVIVWGSILTDPEALFWKTTRGETIYAVRGEHTRVIKGFTGTIINPQKIVVNDPLYGELYYSVEWFLKNWGLFRNSGVVVR